MKICFCSAYISRSLKGNTPGGAELQIALLAKALAKAGHEVVIIDPYAEESFLSEDGVQLIHVPGWNKGIKGLRVLFHRIPALYKLLKAQKADYYYVRMRNYLNLLSYRAAKKVNGKFILAFASDIDPLSLRQKFNLEYKKNFKLGKYLFVHLPNDIAHNILLKRSDIIILQHAGQEACCPKGKGKKALFGNIIDISILPALSKSSNNSFVYAGSLTMLKGADKLYKIADEISKDNTIIVIGQPNDDKSRSIYEQMKVSSNIELKGRMTHYDTVQHIGNAKALINTSDYEGFPNVFLEAWAMGVPVLSLNVNPGNIFNEHQLGQCFDGDMDKMKECMEHNGVATIDKKGMASYIRKFHDFNTAADRFAKIISTNKLITLFMDMEYFEPAMMFV